MILDFSHITGDDWQIFENIVEKYFEELKNDKKRYPNIIDIQTFPTGSGPDGGRDILVDIEFDDTVSKHTIRWVVQCKCYESDVGPSLLKEVNIPTLLHSYDASGYLLVCKKDVTHSLTELFEDLREKCSMGCKYVFWRGADFQKKILDLNWDTSFMKLYFNDYYKYVKSDYEQMEKFEQEIKKSVE